MRKLLLIFALAAVAALVVPGVANGQSPTGDFVEGDQRDFSIGVFFHIHVSSGPAGETPTGTVTFQQGGGNSPFESLDVSCLSVSGNTAIIGFAGTEFDSGFEFPERGLVRVVDAGGFGSGLDTIEITYGVALGDQGQPLPGPTSCSTFPDPIGVFVHPFGPVTTDIVVHDEVAVPTSKDQCKNGGWRNFGSTFKNQGQCVAFVQRGAKA